MADISKSSLLGLQPELLLEIVRHLKASPSCEQDLCRWSSVSSFLRLLLTPYLFTSITLRNNEESGTSIARLACSKYHKNVRALTVVGEAPGDQEDGFEDTEAVLPVVVEQLLFNLSQFPSLESVSINFDMDFDGGWDEGFMLFQDEESPEERREAEQSQAWRALNTRVYTALAQNIDPGFTKLELRDIIPAKASSFNSANFQKLLGHMTHFNLSCWTDQSGDHYSENRRAGYVLYLHTFDELFFNHLSSVTHLDVSASHLPVRLRRSRDAAENLDQLCIPSLRNVALNGFFIDTELVQFFTSHIHTLENIQLYDCHAWSPREFGAVSWSDFFGTLTAAKPPRLSEFGVENDEDIPLFSDYHSTQQDKDEAARVSKYLEAHPERRLFSYSYLDDKYGFLGAVEDANLESFRVGDDQRAFDDLLRIVVKNSAES